MNISTKNAPAPFGHYSQAKTGGDIIFISGQLAAEKDGTHCFDKSFSKQTRQCLGNVLAIARAAGAEKHQILKVTAYIVGVEHWPEFNKIYSEIFGETKPARSVVPVPELHHGYLIEVEAFALSE